ncbi:hypothetical protein [Prescottella agglutinans]|uniref:hypothetical protein n=1 Tax=Prescottella agglutinans TaxID=1644129 RepID=UPI003D95DF97
MFVTAGILTVPEVGTAAAEGLDTDPGTKLCLLIYPPEPGCEGNTSSSSGSSNYISRVLGSIDFGPSFGSIGPEVVPG